jgi:predicted MFS family arabinose efflux permease
MRATGTAEREHAFSLQVALWPLAGFVGSLLGGLLPGFFARVLGVSLASAAAYRYPLLAAAGLYLPAVPVLLATRLPGPHALHSAREEDGRAPWTLIAFVFVVVLLYFAGDGVVRAFYNVYLDGELAVTTAAIGSLYGVALLAATIAGLAAPIVMARWGRRRSFVAMTLGMAASLLPLALVPTWEGAALGIVGVNALGMIARPIITVYQMELVAPRWRAAMSAAGTMGRALSWAATALVGGYLVVSVGYRWVFLAGAALTAIGSGLFWILGRGVTPWNQGLRAATGRRHATSLGRDA